MESVEHAPIPAPGEVVAEKYVVESVVGGGGMGVVLSATHRDLGGRVALKLLRPEWLGDAGMVERFLREARASAAVRSEHVVRVTDVGRLQGGSPFMVMEFLEGTDLDAVVTRRGPLPLAEAVRHLLEACDAVATAHSLGIVHRDLKPANLFLAQRPDGSSVVKLLDFGISKWTGASDPQTSLTHVGQILGSPCYLSPEQLQSGADVDARADIWALGVIFYELVTGHVPFTGPSIAAISAAILRDTPRSVSETHPELPREVDTVIARCLAKAADDRFQDVEALRTALEALLVGPPAARPDRRLLWLAIGTGVLLSLIGVMAMALRTMRPAAEARTATAHQLATSEVAPMHSVDVAAEHQPSPPQPSPVASDSALPAVSASAPPSPHAPPGPAVPHNPLAVGLK